MDERAVCLDAEMTEIVSAAVTAGLGASANDVVLLALRMLWNHYQFAAHGEQTVRELQAAAADLRPGKPADAVFAQLRQRLEHAAGAPEANAA